MVTSDPSIHLEDPVTQSRPSLHHLVPLDCWEKQLMLVFSPINPPISWLVTMRPGVSEKGKRADSLVMSQCYLLFLSQGKILTFGDLQLKSFTVIWSVIYLHNAPVKTCLMCYIFYRHCKHSLGFVIINWILFWVPLVCFNLICAAFPCISSTQVLHMVFVLWFIETWDRNIISSFHWQYTDCRNAVNTCNKNGRNVLTHFERPVHSLLHFSNNQSLS